jgi:hypothetical protein
MSHLKDRTYGPNEHFQRLSTSYGRNQFNEDQIFRKDFNAEDDLETLCDVVIQDPRYNRLCQIWHPKLTNKRGLKQKMKNLIDPVHIPYVGTAIMWNRVRHAEQNREKMVNLQQQKENTPLNPVLEPMVNNTQVQEAGQTAKATAKTFFMFFPVVYAIPGGDPLVAKAAEKGAVKSAEKTAKATLSTDQTDSATYDANETWGATKALLYYLGAPRNNDKIYHTWEDSRIRLKQFFGCGPDDDLNQMKPKGDTLKAIEEAEDSKGGYDLQSLNVPVLVLLWRIYDCWDTPYADKLTSKKHKMKREDQWRSEDEREVLEMINPVDPRIQRLDSDSQKSVVRMLKKDVPTAYGKHAIFSFLDERSDTKREKRLKWLLDTFVKKMIDAEMGWGFFSEANQTSHQGELLAVIFFERAEQSHYDPSDLLSTFSGMMKLQADYRNISSRLSWEDSVMKHNTDKNELPGILHMFACQDSAEGRDALVKLIQSEILYTSIPAYCQEYEGEQERIQILEQCGFAPRTDLSTEDQDRLTFDSKDSNSPRLKIFSYKPHAREEKDYYVPRPQHPTHAPPIQQQNFPENKTTTNTYPQPQPIQPHAQQS